MQIWIPTNPKGAERLAPGIIESESDLFLHRLWGLPSEVCIFCLNILYMQGALDLLIHNSASISMILMRLPGLIT